MSHSHEKHTYIRLGEKGRKVRTLNYYNKKGSTIRKKGQLFPVLYTFVPKCDKHLKHYILKVAMDLRRPFFKAKNNIPLGTHF